MTEKSTNNSFILFLVHVDNDWMDIGGNIYPEEYTEVLEFTRDINIRYGLNGILWGETSIFPYKRVNSGRWLV